MSFHVWNLSPDRREVVGWEGVTGWVNSYGLSIVAGCQYWLGRFEDVSVYCPALPLPWFSPSAPGGGAFSIRLL